MILDEAERLIGKNGYDALRLKDIADAIGIRVPSIYGHYSGRDSVIAGVAIRYIDALADLFPYDGETNPTQALVAGVRGCVRHWIEHPAYTRLRLRDLEAPGGMPELDWVAGGSAAENSQEGPVVPVFAGLTAILQDGHERGEFRKIEVIRFWRDLSGATLMALTYPDQRVLDGTASQEEVEKLVLEIEDLALRLVRPD